MSRTLRLRPLSAEDDEFDYRVYASTREGEFESLGWSSEQTAAFLRMQHAAQRKDYRRRFPDADFDLVLLDGEPIGRLFVHRRSDEIRIVDIALLPPLRGKGHGQALIKRLLDEADSRRVAVRIHVEKQNPARRLYLRLGFEVAEDRGVYDLMECWP